MWSLLRKVGALVVGALLIMAPVATYAHGTMVQPVSRNQAAKLSGKETCPHCLNQKPPCGATNQGSDYNTPGPVKATFGVGSTIDIVVELTAPHRGYFKFGVCTQPSVTQGCFDANPLINAGDRGKGTPYWWLGPQGIGTYKLKFTLPAGVSCGKCVLQWMYHSGNSCEPPNTPAEFSSPTLTKCSGPSDPLPERFWNCADISISGSGGPGKPGTGTSTSTGTSTQGTGTTTITKPRGITSTKRTTTGGGIQASDVIAGALSGVMGGGMAGGLVLATAGAGLGAAVGAGACGMFFLMGVLLSRSLSKKQGFVEYPFDGDGYALANGGDAASWQAVPATVLVPAPQLVHRSRCHGPQSVPRRLAYQQQRLLIRQTRGPARPEPLLLRQSGSQPLRLELPE